MILRGTVIDEQQSEFTGERSHIEIIIHDHEDVYIIGFVFVSDERAEHNQSSQMTGLRRDLVDAFEASSNQLATVRTRSEAGDSFGKRSSVNAGWQIAIFVECRKRNESSSFFHGSQE